MLKPDWKKKMDKISLVLTRDEAENLLAAVGLALDVMDNGVHLGDPASPSMLALEVIQKQLMDKLGD